MDPLPLTTLLTAAALAGWVDAVVGGGGLLLLPALLVAAPGIPVATALGTNKLAAIAGTTTAAATYARHTRIDWPITGPAATLAVLCSATGALLATAVPPNAYRPAVLVVLLAVAIFIATRPQLGLTAQPHRRTPTRIAAAITTTGAAIALYDGLIGPGTGTFLVIAFTLLIGTDFLHSSAMAKVINAGTNLGALAVFALTGHVWWLLGLAMAACNIAGATLGARMALRRGATFVRAVLLTVVLALLAKLGYDQWHAS